MCYDKHPSGTTHYRVSSNFRSIGETVRFVPNYLNDLNAAERLKLRQYLFYKPNATLRLVMGRSSLVLPSVVRCIPHMALFFSPADDRVAAIAALLLCESVKIGEVQ